MSLQTGGSVYLVDDDRDLRRATAQTLELAGFEVQAFARAREALAALPADFAGVIVSDIRMPEMDGLQFFAEITARDPDLPVILITGHGDIPMAVQAIQNGVYDFIPKPFPADYLSRSIARAQEKRALVLENRRLRRLAETVDDDMPMLGNTPAITRLRQTLRQIADTDVDVLVTGETGTGKEVVANLLHQWSHRKRGNFVALNCGALPESVIESELFGHEAGAFTGAQKKRIGRIEHADHGTLFLDEIESIPLSTQVKLLRVLEGRVVTPLGTNEVRPVDFRVVAAAKEDLATSSREGKFREDLFYRLNVVSISIPPLRERRDDIPLLFTYFAGRAAQRFRKDVPDIPQAYMLALQARGWPGNVRELSHVAERFVLGLDEDAERAESALPQLAQETLGTRMDRLEADIIRQTLQLCNGDVRATIENLGIARKTFYDKLSRHGISRADYVREDAGP
ncbi:sigma-54-dependent transcriptional regulator [Rhizobium sp. C4]|uniref:sigma-54-dependent transcriptional regulator n=1 Tax=Rhizobium sp. C4 TaxID=1349800 RepID=UPI001E5E78DA|nr:sigma-54 dependent transcriptional regulator [Rhizobium sp. C4]MCD2172504.1 sigma-54 dependent transcriptional regulator [Rhizobium sp. C4]